MIKKYVSFLPGTSFWIDFRTSSVLRWVLEGTQYHSTVAIAFYTTWSRRVWLTWIFPSFSLFLISPRRTQILAYIILTTNMPSNPYPYHLSLPLSLFFTFLSLLLALIG